MALKGTFIHPLAGRGCGRGTLFGRFGVRPRTAEKCASAERDARPRRRQNPAARARTRGRGNPGAAAATVVRLSRSFGGLRRRRRLRSACLTTGGRGAARVVGVNVSLHARFLPDGLVPRVDVFVFDLFYSSVTGPLLCVATIA